MKLIERICLIIPPSVFLLDERVFMSLGILKVAAVLESSNRRVEILDLAGIENFAEVVRDYLVSSNISIFGITATTPQMPAVTKVVDVIRKTRLFAKIILGGPHATLINAARKSEQAKGVDGRAAKSFQDLKEMFDVIVSGDGEEAIFEALKPDAPKLIDADDIKSNLFLDNSKLDASPFPARHLIDVGSYHYEIDGGKALSLIAQLGCPYSCGFCGGRNSPSFRKIRVRSAKRITEEMELLYKTYSIKGYMFYDDELNISPSVFVELMRAIIKLQERLGVQFKLRGFIRANLFNEEQAELMYQAGFRWLLVGFESGSSKILKAMNKRVTREQNTRCLQIAKHQGLKVKALMSIGHPGESDETLAETHRWLLGVKPDDFDVTIITVYPGTPYYDEAVPHPAKKGIWIYSHENERLYSEEIDYRLVADYYKGNPDGGYKSYVSTDYLTAEEIVRWRDFIERDVRQKLNIPFYPSASAKRYEHSMGMGLPQYILKTN